MTRLRLVQSAGILAATLGLGQMVACTTDDSDPEETPVGSGGTTATDDTGAGTTGSPTAGTSGGTPTAGNTVCANPLVLASTTAGIADFDAYADEALSTWSFSLGGDSSTNVYAGTFGYGDDAGGAPEFFGMVDGADSTTYALSISDSDSTEYGGGMGFWLSDCLDASVFSGISFWARGDAPEGQAEVTISLEETQPSVAAKEGDSIGTCTGTGDECVQPSFKFPVTDEWTEVKIPWSAFTGGNANGTPVSADGSNLWQIQFGVGLQWLPNDAGEYEPVPDSYELAVDTVAFY